MALLSERYINCTCSLDFIDKVPKESLFRVLRQRLPLLEGLYKLIIFNHEPFGTCAELVLSHEDLKQWKVVQGAFFNCSSQFSVPKCKTMSSQSQILFHEILDVQKIPVG